MKEQFKKILYNRRVKKMFLKFFINLHNFCYQKISSLVVDVNGGVHPKHDIMNYHKFFVNNVKKEDVVLDLGCGNGFMTQDVAVKAKKVLGIDKSLRNIKSAKSNYQKDNINFVVGDATKYNFDSKYDRILLSNVLEHIQDRIKFLKSLHQLSEIILLRVPMFDRDWLSVYKKENGYEYRLDETHYIEYTLDSLKKELERAKWKIKNYDIQFGELWGVVVDNEYER